MSIQINKKTKIGSVILVSLFILYGVVGFMVLPWYANKALGEYVSKQLQRELVIEKIYFNPFTFHLRADNIALKEKNQVPIASLIELDINIDLDQLLKKTLVVSTLRLNEPRLELIIDETGSMNLDHLLSELPATDSDSGDDPALNFIFESTAIQQGSVLIVDYSKEQSIQSLVKDINLEFSSISTFANEEGNYQIDLDLDKNTRAKLTGTLSLTPLMSVGQFQIADLSAATINRWGKDMLPVEIQRGSAAISGSYKLVSNNEGNISFNIDNTSIKVEDLSIEDVLTKMSLSLKELNLNDVRYSSSDLTASVNSISLVTLNASTQESEPLIDLANISFSDIEYDIESVGLTLSAIKLDKLVFAPRNGMAALGQLDRATVGGIKFDGNTKHIVIGKVELVDNHYLFETDTAGQLMLPEFKIAGNDANKSDAGEETSPAAFHIELGELHLAQTSLALFNSALPEQLDQLLSLKEIVLKSADVDLSQSSVALTSLTLDDANINLTLDKTGVLNVLQLIPADSDAEEKNSTSEEASPIQFKLDKLTTQGFNIKLTDNSSGTSVQHYLHDIKLEAANISNDDQVHTDLSVNAVINERGELSLAGWVALISTDMELELGLSEIDFTYLNPYLKNFTNVSLASGIFNFNGHISNAAGKNGLSIRDAKAGLINLQLNDMSDDSRLIAVEAVTIAGLGFTSSPLNINIKQTKLSGPYANVHIDEQKNLNLLNAFKSANSESNNSEQENADFESTYTLSLERIDLDKGNMDFADLSMTPQFSVKMHELTGTAAGLNSDPERYTSLELNGQVNEFGSIAIKGELQPFDYRKQSQINMVFKNISTNSLSPYAAKFAGRKIKSGSLSLTLDYKIANNNLDGSNNIVLESLVLGEEVESPDAMDLPLDMAISLLEDDNGKIDIKLPIKGDLNSPEFEINAVIQKAIGNLLGGIVTAPFKFIGSLFGMSGDELKFIRFVPGKTEIAPPEAEKLSTISKVLLDRPALLLIVSGVYDKTRDSKALAKKSLIEIISKITEKEQIPLNYSDPEVQETIADLADERLDEAIRIKLQESVIGDKTEDDAAAKKIYYSSLFQRLTEIAAKDISQSVLDSLAGDRARAIIDYVTGTEASLTDRVTYSDELVSDNADTEVVNVTLKLDTRR